MTAPGHLTALLAAFDSAGAEIVAEINRRYPPFSKVRARVQSNHPASELKVMGAIPDRPGYLRVMYESGYDTTIHVRDIEE